MGILVCRLFWFMGGPFLLLLLTYWIVVEGEGWATIIDLSFALVIAAMILARWAEFAGGNATDAYGVSLTGAKLKRYALVVAIVGLTLWLVANVIGNHMLTAANG
jgi:hypothetical protein